jgi:hypothetical protein
MATYYYAGQFGYFNVIILPLLSNYSGNKLTIYTYPDYCYILNNLFPNKFICIPINYNLLRFCHNCLDNSEFKQIYPSLEIFSKYVYVDFFDINNNLIDLNTYNPSHFSTIIKLNNNMSIYSESSINSNSISKFLLESTYSDIPKVLSYYKDISNTITNSINLKNNQIINFFNVNNNLFENYFDFSNNRINYLFDISGYINKGSKDKRDNLLFSTFTIKNFKNSIIYDTSSNSYLNVINNINIENRYSNSDLNIYLSNNRNIISNLYDISANRVKHTLSITKYINSYLFNIDGNLINNNINIDLSTNKITNSISFNNNSLTFVYDISSQLLLNSYDNSNNKIVKFYDNSNNLLNSVMNLDIHQYGITFNIHNNSISNNLILNGKGFIDSSNNLYDQSNNNPGYRIPINLYSNATEITSNLKINGDNIKSKITISLKKNIFGIFIPGYDYQTQILFNDVNFIDSSMNTCNSYFYVGNNAIINFFDINGFNLTRTNFFTPNNKIITNNSIDTSDNSILFTFDTNQKIANCNFNILNNISTNNFNINQLTITNNFNSPDFINGLYTLDLSRNILSNNFNLNGVTMNNLLNINANIINSFVVSNNNTINTSINIINSIKYQVLTDLVNINQMSNYSFIPNKITTSYEDLSSNNYICYFPRNRTSGDLITDWDLRNASIYEIQTIVTFYKDKYKIFVLGNQLEILKPNNTYYNKFNISIISDIDKMIFYLQNCKFLISNDSGFIDFAKNCGCPKILILNPINSYHTQFNPPLNYTLTKNANNNIIDSSNNIIDINNIRLDTKLKKIIADLSNNKNFNYTVDNSGNMFIDNLLTYNGIPYEYVYNLNNFYYVSTISNTKYVIFSTLKAYILANEGAIILDISGTHILNPKGTIILDASGAYLYNKNGSYKLDNKGNKILNPLNRYVLNYYGNYLFDPSANYIIDTDAGTKILDINKNKYQILKDISSNNFILKNTINNYIIKNIDGITPYYVNYLQGSGLKYEYIASEIYVINYDILQNDLESQLFY